MKRKVRNFRLEVWLGLAVIVLVLVILNFASHYTILRVKRSVESQIKNDLYEAVVVTSNRFHSSGTAFLNDSVLNEIINDYKLERLDIVHLNYDRVMGIRNQREVDPVFLKFDSTINSEDIEPLIGEKAVFRHHYGDRWNVLFFPTEYTGSKFIIAAEKESGLLSSLENAAKILIYSAFLGILVIIYAALKLTRFISYPFSRLKEKAQKAGHIQDGDDDEINILIKTYENIIEQLKEKEKELLRLNEIVSKKADALEVYNNYILSSINTGIITLDIGGKVVTVNNAAEKMLKISGPENEGISYEKLLSGHKSLAETVGKFFEGSTIDERNIEIVRGNEKKRIISVSIAELSDGHGETIGTTIILHDLTEQINLREELESRERMATLGEMSGGLAHQLRNSVGAIIGFAGLIKKKVADDETSVNNIEYLIKEASEAESLVSRFLDFARPLRLEPQIIYISDVIEDIVKNVQDKFCGIKISFNSSVYEKITISGDDLLLKQAIGNIIQNACRAVEDNGGGKVRIDIKENPGNISILIADDGSGIPDDYREKIFAPFFSGSPSGTGLGLPLARKIITLHDGKIDYESSPESGTVFNIILPTANNLSKSSSKATVSHSV